MWLFFKAVGCHWKSTGAAQSALNLAGSREGGLESGEGQKKKSTPMSDTKLESGREELGHWAVVCLFLNSWDVEWNKKEIPDLAKHKLTPVCLLVSSCCSAILLPMLYSLLLFSPPDF